MLSPGRGEQIKGDFAAAPKVGEVHLEANSTAKLAGDQPNLTVVGYISGKGTWVNADYMLQQYKLPYTVYFTTQPVFDPFNPFLAHHDYCCMHLPSAVCIAGAGQMHFSMSMTVQQRLEFSMLCTHAHGACMHSHRCNKRPQGNLVCLWHSSMEQPVHG